VARELIEECIQRGEKIDEVRSRSEWLQTEILRLKLAREERQDPKKLVFLDRGLPDSLTYFRIAGLDLSAAKKASLRFRYRAVFIFDRLAVVQDGIRTESDELARQMDIALEQDYRDLQYSPIRVPVIPIAARADFVLKAVDALQLQEPKPA
jgi:predicted ATPase